MLNTLHRCSFMWKCVYIHNTQYYKFVLTVRNLQTPFLREKLTENSLLCLVPCYGVLDPVAKKQVTQMWPWNHKYCTYNAIFISFTHEKKLCWKGISFLCLKVCILGIKDLTSYSILLKSVPGIIYKEKKRKIWKGITSLTFLNWYFFFCRCFVRIWLKKQL
jgi:hypothetical protein